MGSPDASVFPPPPVPPDLDLTRHPWYPIDVKTLMNSRLLIVPDAELFRIGVLSWIVAWHQVPAGSLPDDDEYLAQHLGFGRDVETWRKYRENGALRGWKRHSDGLLYHPFVTRKVLATISPAENPELRAEEKKAADAERKRRDRALKKMAGKQAKPSADSPRTVTGQSAEKTSSEREGERDREREEEPKGIKSDRGQAALEGVPAPDEGAHVLHLIEIYNAARRAMRGWQGKPKTGITATAKVRKLVRDHLEQYPGRSGFLRLASACFGVFLDPFRRGEKPASNGWRGECFELAHVFREPEKLADAFVVVDRDLADMPGTLARFVAALDRSTAGRVQGRTLATAAPRQDRAERNGHAELQARLDRRIAELSGDADPATEEGRARMARAVKEARHELGL